MRPLLTLSCLLLLAACGTRGPLTLPPKPAPTPPTPQAQPPAAGGDYGSKAAPDNAR